MFWRLIDWILARRGYMRVLVGTGVDWVPPHVRALTAEALPLVVREEPKPQTGEFKKAQVYARMLKMHPDLPKRDVSWGIERAVRKFLDGV